MKKRVAWTMLAAPLLLLCHGVEAQAISGDACLSGSALRKLEAARQSGDLIAIRTLAAHYGSCEEDAEAKVVSLYEEAARFGFASDLWNLGVTLEEQGLNEQAFPILLRAAKLGDREAARRVANAYVEGKGTSKDLGEAETWFESDANRCSKVSAIDLSRLLASSTQREKKVKALAWLRAAVRLGHGSVNAQIVRLEEQLRNELGLADDRLASEISSDLASTCSG